VIADGTTVAAIGFQIAETFEEAALGTAKTASTFSTI
jgi:hypothetical protein